jgi:hypothetical protein
MEQEMRFPYLSRFVVGIIAVVVLLAVTLAVTGQDRPGDPCEPNSSGAEELRVSTEPKRDDAGVEMPAEKVYHLMKIQVLEETQEELLKWAKRRFWLVTIAAIVLGIVGVRALVRDLISKELSGATKAAAAAEASAEDAREATRAAREQLSDFRDELAAVQETASRIQMTLQKLEARSGILGNQVAQAGIVSANAAKEAASLRTDLTGEKTRPTITRWSSNIADPTLEITGDNFGDEPGKVTLFWISDVWPTADTTFSDPIILNGREATEWTASQIDFTYSAEHKKKAERWLASHGHGDTNIMLCVETADGRRAATDDSLGKRGQPPIKDRDIESK